jgi:hypothetical protein
VRPENALHTNNDLGLFTTCKPSLAASTSKDARRNQWTNQIAAKTATAMLVGYLMFATRAQCVAQDRSQGNIIANPPQRAVGVQPPSVAGPRNDSPVPGHQKPGYGPDAELHHSEPPHIGAGPNGMLVLAGIAALNAIVSVIIFACLHDPARASVQRVWGLLWLFVGHRVPFPMKPGWYHGIVAGLSIHVKIPRYTDQIVAILSGPNYYELRPMGGKPEGFPRSGQLICHSHKWKVGEGSLHKDVGEQGDPNNIRLAIRIENKPEILVDLNALK